MSVKPLLTIVGGGMGEPELLTQAAWEAIANAVRIYAPPRLAESLQTLNDRIQPASVGETLTALRGERTPATVIVSGDAGFFSLSETLARELSEHYRLQIINGISSLQYLCGRLGISYQDVHVVSLHGRSANAVAAVTYHRWVFFLAGGTSSAESVLDELCRAGLGHVNVTVAENLSAPEEHITTAAARMILEREYAGLAVLLVENPSPASPHVRLRDSDFIRHTTPMTKEAVRTLSVARLNIQPADTVWDIGAGTGSVSVALAHAAHSSFVFAVERDPDAVELVRQNREKFSAYNIVVLQGAAPAALAGLPAPDKVFIGGSGGNLRELLEYIKGVSPRFTVCINAVTLETLTEATACLEALGFAEVECSCINAAVSREAGSYHLMSAQNPVYILSGRMVQ